MEEINRVKRGWAENTLTSESMRESGNLMSVRLATQPIINTHD